MELPRTGSKRDPRPVNCQIIYIVHAAGIVEVLHEMVALSPLGAFPVDNFPQNHLLAE